MAARMTKGDDSLACPEEKLDRKIVERNRRNQMKDLCFKLTSLIPPHHFKPSKELLSQPDQLDQVATYIMETKERIDKLEARKAQLLLGNNNEGSSSTNRDDTRSGLKLPVVDLKEVGSSLEVVLICELMIKNFILYEVIHILDDEGAEVLSANFSTVGDKAFYIVHAQAKVCRVGVETSSVRQRLQELVY